MDFEKKQKIQVGLLQPGVFIQLDCKWGDHPFLFNKFKLKNWYQIEALEKAGINDVFWIPEMSDHWPILEADALKEPKPISSVFNAEDPLLQLMWKVKKEQMEHLRQVHEGIRQSNRDYERIMNTLPDLMNKISTGSSAAIKRADEVVAEMVNIFMSATGAVVHLVNTKENGDEFQRHALNVSVLAMMLGQKAELTTFEMNVLGMAALFHDIGKTQIERKILKKNSPFSRAELAIIQRHPQYGADVLKKSGISDIDLLTAVKDHHEFYDGMGYPSGLKGEKISKLARIITITNLYDNLCNNPDRAKKMTPYETLSYMYTKQQHHLDMELFALFIRGMGIYPPGTFLKLSNGDIGIVITINSRNPLKPYLLLYDSHIPREQALICEMEDNDINIEKSLHMDEVPDQVRQYLNTCDQVIYYMGKT